MGFRAILYDLDGTLVETLPDLAASINASLLDLGQPSVGEAEVRDAIGDGAKELVRRLLPPPERGRLLDEAYRRFKEHYLAHCADSSFVLPSAREFLAERRADPAPPFQAIVSNKEHSSTDLLVRRFGFDAFLDAWTGSEAGFPRKPDPAVVHHFLGRAGVAPEEALMIGDSRADIDVARAAGVRVVAFTTGYGRLEEIEARRPDWTFPDIAALRTAWPLA